MTTTQEELVKQACSELDIQDFDFVADIIDWHEKKLAEQKPVGYFQRSEKGAFMEKVRDEFKNDPDVFPLYTGPMPAPEPVAWLQEKDLSWLIRFKETSEDDNSYDTPKTALKRLIEIGVVRSVGFGRCEITSFGEWIIERHFEQNTALPLKTQADWMPLPEAPKE